ncbi:MAG: transcriptional repressor [Rhodospirillaceae bacterium]|nr:transcriptional repressor [Rhodospirillaceae bacterium]|tara:strand:- start:14 stop:442 length:429 start_codon:yes stop_codon:yes gene_type:complete
MNETEIYSTEALHERLRAAGMRPTRQREELAELLFRDGNRHVTAEVLHREAAQDGIQVSLATIYNTLHQFTEAGLLREVVVDSGRAYFDTNTGPHHHFFNIESQELTDIPPDSVAVGDLPVPPAGTTIDAVDIVIRVAPQGR